MGEGWNVWRDLVAPLAVIVLVCAVAYLVGGANVFNP